MHNASLALADALASRCGKEIDGVNHWYRWGVNAKRLPHGVTLPEGNGYSVNLSLKKALSRCYACANDEEKIALTRYYIVTWGGVRGNAPETLRSYALDDTDQIKSLGIKGIASWSKALCIRNPEKEAIFDARVSVSLNAIQALSNVADPAFFPMLTSRNTKIRAHGGKLSSFAKEHNWAIVKPTDVYPSYIRLLNDVAASIGCELATVEMWLFAKAEELLSNAVERH